MLKLKVKDASGQPVTNDALSMGATSVLNRVGGASGKLTSGTIVQEFLNVLNAKQLYGPRLWDTPGVVGMQLGLSKTGRPLLDVIVERPGDIPKIPTFLQAPGPEGKLIKLRARAVGYRLQIPKKRLSDAYNKLDTLLYNLQGYRSAGLSFLGKKQVGLAAVLVNRKDGQYIPEKIDGFPVRTFYFG